MKVKVKRIVPIMYAHPALQAEFEKLFQENKDLRVREGHLGDDITALQRRIEVLLSANSDKDKLIDELNDQIDANESEVEFWQKAAKENSEVASDALKDATNWEASAHEAATLIAKMQATIDRLEAQIVAMGKKNDSITAEMVWWKAKAKEATAELVQYDVGKYQREIEEWQATADELAERCDCYKQERDMARDEVKRLSSLEDEVEKYQDIANRRKDRIDELMKQIRELETEFAELQIEHQELGEDYDALVKTKLDYAEEIGRLREENKRLRNQMPLPEYMRRIIELTREAVQNEFPDSSNS